MTDPIDATPASPPMVGSALALAPNDEHRERVERMQDERRVFGRFPEGVTHLIHGVRAEGKTRLAMRWLLDAPEGTRVLIVPTEAVATTLKHAYALNAGYQQIISYRRFKNVGPRPYVEYGIDDTLHILSELLHLPGSPNLVTIAIDALTTSTPESLDGATHEAPPNAYPATPGEFAARWNTWTHERRQEWLTRAVQNAEAASRCDTLHHPLEVVQPAALAEQIGKVIPVRNEAGTVIGSAKVLDGGVVSMRIPIKTVDRQQGTPSSEGEVDAASDGVASVGLFLGRDTPEGIGAWEPDANTAASPSVAPSPINTPTHDEETPNV